MSDQVLKSVESRKTLRSGSDEEDRSQWLRFRAIELSKNAIISPSWNSKVPDPLKFLSLSSPPLRDFSVYLRLHHRKVGKCLWLQMIYKEGKHANDKLYEGPMTKILEQEDASWEEDRFSVIDNRFFKFNRNSTLTLDPREGGKSKLAWERVPWRKLSGFIVMVACLKKVLYAVSSPSTYVIPPDGWIEVLRPQSTEWEPLSLHPPQIRRFSNVFFHAVDELDKLLFGSFDENVLYLYDPKPMAVPEKVESFSSIPRCHTDSVVVGRYLIWLTYDDVFVYDLASRELRYMSIAGMDPYYSRAPHYYMTSRLLYFGGHRFCLITHDYDDEMDFGSPAVLRVFEFSFSGPYLQCPRAGSSYKHEILTSSGIHGAFVVDEGENESAKLMSDATAAAGKGLIDPRSEASREVLGNMAGYPNADGNNMLSGLGTGL